MLLKMNSKFVWTAAEEQSFHEIKAKLVSKPDNLTRFVYVVPVKDVITSHTTIKKLKEFIAKYWDISTWCSNNYG